MFLAFPNIISIFVPNNGNYNYLETYTKYFHLSKSNEKIVPDFTGTPAPDPGFVPVRL